MQIILLHPRFTTKSVTLGSKHIFLGLLTFTGAVFLVAALLEGHELHNVPFSSLVLFSDQPVAVAVE